MSAGVDTAIEVLGEALAAYKARVAELEAVVANQQRQLETAKALETTPQVVTESIA